MKFIILISLFFLINGCDMGQSKTENQYISEMETLLKEKLSSDYQIGETQRATHVKSHGLLKGHFRVIDNLPEELKVGIFKNTKTYESWVRISNARGKWQSDKIKDFRGLSIKLLDMDNELQNTNDFVFQSYPTMALGTVKDFRDGMYYDIKKNRLYAALAFIFFSIMKKSIGLRVTKEEEIEGLDIAEHGIRAYPGKRNR